MTTVKARVSKELYEMAEQLAKKRGVATRVIIDEALTAYLYGAQVHDKPVKSIKSSIITLQFASKCRKCKKQLDAGDLAYWVRTEFEDGTSLTTIHCLDCYYSGHGLKEQYVKKRKLEIIIRELKKEADMLISQIDSLKQELEELKLYKEIAELINEIKSDYTQLWDSGFTGDIMDKLEELREKLENIYSIVKEKIEANQRVA